MRPAAGLLFVLILAGCQERPGPRPVPEKEEPWGYGREGRRDRFAAEHKQVQGDLALASGKMPRAADPREQNIRVSVTYLDVEEYQRIAASAGAAYHDGSVGVRAGAADFRRNGLAVAMAGKHWAASLAASGSRGRSVSRTEQFIVVANGTQGMIHVGEVTPVGRLVYFGPGGAAYTVDLVGTGARLAVQPEIVDPERELIRVRLWPDLSVLRADGGVEVTRIETEVVVPNGHGIVIGGLPTSQASIARALFSYRAGSQVRQRFIILTPSY